MTKLNHHGLPCYLIYGKDNREAAKLAATMDLHLSQWKFRELFVDEAFAIEEDLVEE